MIREFQFQSFDGEEVQVAKEVESADEFVNSTIGSEKLLESDAQDEIAYSQSTTFRISPVVKRHRGLTVVEKKNFERKVQQKVDQSLIKLKKQGYEDGYRRGLEEGFSKSKAEADEHFAGLIQDFSQYLAEITSYKNELIEVQKDNMFKMLKILTKWVILKEVEDEEYLHRLFEKLINEIHCKTDLVVRVDQENFEKMPDVIERLEGKIGELTNVRLEVDRSMTQKGLVIESPKGIVDGSLEAQFGTLNHLFRQIGIGTKEPDEECIPNVELTPEASIDEESAKQELSESDIEEKEEHSLDSSVNIDELVTSEEEPRDEQLPDTLDVIDDEEDSEED